MDNLRDFSSQFLEDKFNDVSLQCKFLKMVVLLFIGIISLLIISLVGLSIYNTNTIKKVNDNSMQMFIDFVNENEFYSEVNLDTNNHSINKGNLTIKK